MALDTDFTNIFFKPLVPYLNNPNTAEIMVNSYDDIWVEDEKGLYKIPETFAPDSLDAAVKALAQYVGRPIVDNVFAIDARMPDKSRICIILPPISGDSPSFAIRLFKSAISDLGFLIDKGSLTQEMVEMISAMVKIKKNMLVAGGTSSGKTTLLNLIAATIPNDDRIITIEDSKELQLKQEHILSLEARPADKNGNGAFSIRDCLKSTLRLRPDRIVVGEIRGGESFDLIQAMNTGHGGCMGTVHANNALETLKRMESIALMADIEIPLIALRSMLASALDVVISPARLIDHSRKVVQIAEVLPLDTKENYQIADIAKYTSTKFDPVTKKLEGYFEFTGHMPTFFDMFAAEGVDIPREFFRKRIVGELPSNETCEKLKAEGYEIAGFTNKTIIANQEKTETITHIKEENTPAPEVKPAEDLTQVNENNSLLERLKDINNNKEQETTIQAEIENTHINTEEQSVQTIPITEETTEESLPSLEEITPQEESYFVEDEQQTESNVEEYIKQTAEETINTTLPTIEPEFETVANGQDFFTLDDIQDFEPSNKPANTIQQQEIIQEPVIQQTEPQITLDNTINNEFTSTNEHIITEEEPEIITTNSELTDDDIFNSFINGDTNIEFPQEEDTTALLPETEPLEQQEAIPATNTLSDAIPTDELNQETIQLPEVEEPATQQFEQTSTSPTNKLQDKIQQSKDKQASTIASIIKRMKKKK